MTDCTLMSLERRGIFNKKTIDWYVGLVKHPHLTENKVDALITQRSKTLSLTVTKGSLSLSPGIIGEIMEVTEEGERDWHSKCYKCKASQGRWVT